MIEYNLSHSLPSQHDVQVLDALKELLWSSENSNAIMQNIGVL